MDSRPVHHRREALNKIRQLLKERGKSVPSSVAAQAADGSRSAREFVEGPLTLWADASGAMISVTYKDEIVVAHDEGYPIHWLDGSWEDALDAAYLATGMKLT